MTEGFVFFVRLIFSYEIPGIGREKVNKILCYLMHDYRYGGLGAMGRAFTGLASKLNTQEHRDKVNYF